MDDHNQQETHRSSPFILVVVLLVFGVVLGGVGFMRYTTARASAEWPTVNGTVTSSRVQTTRRDGKNEYMPRVQYSYVVDGQSFSGTRITASDEYQKNRGSADDILGRYPSGTAVTVFYDPQDPARAVLEQGLPGNVKVLLGAGVACLALAVLIGISAAGGKAQA